MAMVQTRSQQTGLGCLASERKDSIVPDDRNGEDLEWEDIENRLDDIHSLQDNGETSQGIAFNLADRAWLFWVLGSDSA